MPSEQMVASELPSLQAELNATSAATAKRMNQVRFCSRFLSLVG
jgi:hypothetical protein